MHPGVNGPKFKDKPAIIMAGSGEILTHQEVNELSNQIAHLFRSLGLNAGDSMAFMMENHKYFLPIAAAAYRSVNQTTSIGSCSNWKKVFMVFHHKSHAIACI